MISRSALNSWCAVALLALALAACTPPGQQLAQEESQAYYSEGMDKLSEGKYLAAAAAFERAIQRNPDFREAHFQLGTLYHQPLTNYVYALYHLQRSIEINPRDPDASSAKQQIHACKKELVYDVPGRMVLGPADLLARDESLSQAQAKIDKLQGEIGQLKTALAQANSRSPEGTIESRTPNDNTSQSRLGQQQTTPARRTHRVAAGETLYGISRNYGTTVAAIEAVNPGIDSRTLKINQVINLPPETR